VLTGALQGDGYSVASHDVSDLGALTARSPWVMLTAQVIAGTLIIAFALFALGPAVAVPGRGPALGAWLLAASLIGLDNLSDTFFRLDCRAADQGCTAAAAASSWHGQVHIAVGLLSAIAMVAAPFFLAARMRQANGWRDLARPTILAGASARRPARLRGARTKDGRWLPATGGDRAGVGGRRHACAPCPCPGAVTRRRAPALTPAVSRSALGPV
jgi:hypothetical protein